MSIEINGKNLSKMYIGTSPTDATKIPMSKTDTKTVAYVINENKDNITTLNQSLNTEITNRQNEDAKKLSLTGGTLSDVLKITKNGESGYVLENTLNNRRAHLWLNQYAVYVSSYKAIGDLANCRQILIQNQDTNTNDAKALKYEVYKDSAFTSYDIYGTHNITVSTYAPSSALAEGAQHQVYA